MDVGPSETRASSSPSHPPDPGGFAPGHVLADRYRIVALVGRGGMGEVYRADDLKLGQPVALKFLPAELERDPIARVIACSPKCAVRGRSRTRTSAVCTTLATLGDACSSRWSTSTGKTWRHCCGGSGGYPRRRRWKSRGSSARACRRRTTRAVLHRDLKPANVMIDGRGQARITDFGLAVNAQAGESPSDFAGTLPVHGARTLPRHASHGAE